MRRLFAALIGLTATGLLVSLGAPWWIVALDTGATVTITGLGASAVASSLLAAAAAALGLGFVLRGWLRRAVGGIYLAAVVGALFAWADVVQAPELAARSQITDLTGLAGDSGLSVIASVGPTGFLWLGLCAAGLGVISGVIGVVMPDRGARASRYEVHSEGDPGDPVVAWDRLSDGDDPTNR
jgi:hypothetical protein